VILDSEQRISITSGAAGRRTPNRWFHAGVHVLDHCAPPPPRETRIISPTYRADKQIYIELTTNHEARPVPSPRRRHPEGMPDTSISSITSVVRHPTTQRAAARAGGGPLERAAARGGRTLERATRQTRDGDSPQAVTDGGGSRDGVLSSYHVFKFRLCQQDPDDAEDAQKEEDLGEHLVVAVELLARLYTDMRVESVSAPVQCGSEEA